MESLRSRYPLDKWKIAHEQILSALRGSPSDSNSSSVHWSVQDEKYARYIAFDEYHAHVGVVVGPISGNIPSILALHRRYVALLVNAITYSQGPEGKLLLPSHPDLLYIAACPYEMAGDYTGLFISAIILLQCNIPALDFCREVHRLYTHTGDYHRYA